MAFKQMEQRRCLSHLIWCDPFRLHSVEDLNSHSSLLILPLFGRLELEWRERKTLLPGWWLEAGAGTV